MPLYATALALAPDPSAASVSSTSPLVLVTVDLGWLLKDETETLLDRISATTSSPKANILLQLSHTHAGPSMTRPFVDEQCPGGDLAMQWWADLQAKVGDVAAQAIAELQPAWLESAEGSCDLAQKRDFYDRCG